MLLDFILFSISAIVIIGGFVGVMFLFVYIFEVGPLEAARGLRGFWEELREVPSILRGKK